MVACGIYLILFFGAAFWLSTKHRLGESRAWLWLAVVSLPVPWLAIELGWVVAEYGRQPWVVEGVLPTFYAASGLSITDLAISLVLLRAALHEPRHRGGDPDGQGHPPRAERHRSLARRVSRAAHTCRPARRPPPTARSRHPCGGSGLEAWLMSSPLPLLETPATQAPQDEVEVTERMISS